MLRQKTSSFFLLLGIIILSTITFSLFPLQSESGDIYTYTDEKGIIVITNMPLPDKVRNKAKKVDSYKDITDEDRKRWEKEKEDAMQSWRDAQATEEERTKKRIEAEARIEAEKAAQLKRTEVKVGEAIEAADEARARTRAAAAGSASSAASEAAHNAKTAAEQAQDLKYRVK